MLGMVQSGLCALVLYASAPLQDALKVPSGEKQRFEYVVNVPIFMLKANIGTVVWEYEAKSVTIKSDFKVKTTNQLVRDLVGANLVHIKSRTNYNQYDNSLNLESYLYEEFVDGDKLKFGLLFQNNETVCGKNLVSQVIIVPCDGKPTGSVPDLFALLAGVAYVNDLEGRVEECGWQSAFYGTKEEKVQFKKIEKKSIQLNGSEIPLVIYNVENIAALLDRGVIKIIVGLREKYPHFMEYALVETRAGMITLERKQ